MKLISKLWPLTIAIPVFLLVLWAAGSPVALSNTDSLSPSEKEHSNSGEQTNNDQIGKDQTDNDRLAVISDVDKYFTQRWQDEQLSPAHPADELTIIRRMSLALLGTVPSLEEIRLFEADTSTDRLERWVNRTLDDPRFADYFAERLARCFVGTEEGPFVIYRRDRFVSWLSTQLKENSSYDEIVRKLISERGLWTSSPATNFITIAIENENLNEEKLAARTVRAFLGQRIDCAQCHDHPFAEWKQGQFEGLAAFFAQSTLTASGVVDNPEVKFTVQDRETLEEKTIAPAVPFSENWWTKNEGTQREQLAAWVTHSENRRFERATVNRVWGLLFGRPFISPVDDLPDPNPDEIDALDIIGTDFREHGYDLKRLIHVIVGTRSYQLSSESDAVDSSSLYQLSSDWAVFPLTRLRPEQVIGSLFQSAFLKTVDRESHWVVRTIRLLNENNFIREYGDLGDQELDEHSGTIPQALLRMNGELPANLAQPNILTAAGRIAQLCSDPEKCIETCFLVCLTRRPTAIEREHLLPQFKEDRESAVQDLYWAMFNSPEFSWNH